MVIEKENNHIKKGGRLLAKKKKRKERPVANLIGSKKELNKSYQFSFSLTEICSCSTLLTLSTTMKKDYLSTEKPM